MRTRLPACFKDFIHSKASTEIPPLETLTLMLQYAIGNIDSPLTNRERIDLYTHLPSSPEKLIARHKNYDRNTLIELLNPINLPLIMRGLLNYPDITEVLCHLACHAEVPLANRQACLYFLSHYERSSARLVQLLKNKLTLHENRVRVSNIDNELSEIKKTLEQVTAKIENQNTAFAVRQQERLKERISLQTEISARFEKLENQINKAKENKPTTSSNEPPTVDAGFTLFQKK